MDSARMNQVAKIAPLPGVADDSNSAEQLHLQRPFISLTVTLAMAIACGVLAANIYYNQPLLLVMEATFRDSPGVVSLVPTATQLGFAVGLWFLVPLGDLMERRRLILVQSGVLVITLAAAAMATSAWTLVYASFLMGIAAPIAQQIIPFAAELADPRRRGQTIGMVMSGLLCGVLSARVVAGFVGGRFGWQTMFWLGALLTSLVAVMLAVVLPKSPPKFHSSYPRLLKSIWDLTLEEPDLRFAASIQGMVFGSFTVFWTALTLHLAANYQMGPEVAGMFGIIGILGILFAPLAGRFADRRGPHKMIGIGATTMLAGWLVFGVWNSIAGLIVGVLLIDFAQQACLLSNQHVVFSLRPEARNRVNTVLMGMMFFGGTLGSAGAILTWRYGGWPVVCWYGAALIMIALCLHWRGRISAVRRANSLISS